MHKKWVFDKKELTILLSLCSKNKNNDGPYTWIKNGCLIKKSWCWQ